MLDQQHFQANSRVFLKKAFPLESVCFNGVRYRSVGGYLIAASLVLLCLHLITAAGDCSLRLDAPHLGTIKVHCIPREMADSPCTDNCVKRMTTDFSGRPPFKRSFEMVPASEIRAEEAAKAAAKAKKPKFLGTPPYKKRIRTIGR